MTVSAATSSSYLGYLPAVFQEDGDFLGRFLLAFEHVLTGVGDADDPGLEELLDGGARDAAGRELGALHRYFHPGLADQGDLPENQRAPTEFLGWLARWVALVPRGDVSETIVRTLIARAVQLYRKRGTREGIEELLSIYGLNATIEEPQGWFEVGVSRVGVETRLDGPRPFYFELTAPIPTSDQDVLRRWNRLVRAVLDSEKPAHTFYHLDLQPITLELEVHSTIGVDTIIG